MIDILLRALCVFPFVPFVFKISFGPKYPHEIHNENVQYSNHNGPLTFHFRGELWHKRFGGVDRGFDMPLMRKMARDIDAGNIGHRGF